MLELKDCPQVSVVVRWGWSKRENVLRKARNAAKKLEYLSFGFDPAVKVKNTGVRLPVMERVICVYEDELETCLLATKGCNLYGFVFMTRQRSTFGEEFEFMEKNLIENPGFIIISDCGLNQFLAADDVPGQEQLSPNTVTAKMSWALRIAVTKGVKMFCIRHQKGTGSAVKGMPPQATSAATGFLTINPRYIQDMQQFFAFSADAKGTWPKQNFYEDRMRVQSEKKVSGEESIALFEGMAIRFGETDLVRVRYSGLDHERCAREAGVKPKKNYAKCHG